jgi:hypothetical protein
VAGPDEPDRDAAASGSIDVDVSSSSRLPQAATVPRDRKGRRRAPTIGGRVADKVADTIEQAAEKMHLPVPKTRKSRVLVRSVVVGFLVVAGWIVGLVWWQLRGASKPDLRPVALHIMEQLRAGEYDKVYQDSSPRFQEIVLEGDFARQMANMNATLGPFKEITSVTATEIVHGPSGTAARVSLLMAFEKSKAVRGALSFHLEDREWKLLGVSVDLPTEIEKIETSEDKRLARVKGDPIVITQALIVLLRIERGETAKVWEDAAPVFKTAVSKDDLAALERIRAKEIGRFVRIADITSNKQDPGGHGDSLELLVEYDGIEKPLIAVHFEFTRTDLYRAWQLSTYKPIMPLPRVPAK